MKIDALEIARLDVKAGDTVVVKVNRPLTQGDAAHAREYVSASLPADVKVLVLDVNADLTLIKQPTRPQPARRR